MKSTRILKKRREETGQSMVELAVSFIILLLLLSGVVDLGRLAFYYLAMRDAAQEGASYASIFPNDCGEIEKRILTGPVDESRVDITIQIDSATCQQVCPSLYSPGDIIEVTVTDPKFQTTMPFFTHEINLSAFIQDKIIRVPECTP